MYLYKQIWSNKWGLKLLLQGNGLCRSYPDSLFLSAVFDTYCTAKRKHDCFEFPCLLIPTFHWTKFPLRSWRSRSFSKIIPNRSRSVDSHTIWGLHASSTLLLCFYNTSVTLLPHCSRFGCVVIALLLRSRYDNEDPTTLSLR